MQFKYLNADEIGKFENCFRDDLLLKSGLSFDELETLSKREFNELINIVYKDEPVNKDNIHLYYEFMSDNEFYTKANDIFIEKEKKTINILREILSNRMAKTLEKLGKETVFDGFSPFVSIDCSKISKSLIGYSLFGIKDTLKPIEEYTEEIKASSEYKEYALKMKIDNIIKEKDFNRLEYWHKKAILEILFDNFKNVFSSYSFMIEKNYKINSLGTLIKYVKNDNHIVKFSLNDKTIIDLYSNNGAMSIEDDVFKMFQEYIASLA